MLNDPLKTRRWRSVFFLPKRHSRSSCPNADILLKTFGFNYYVYLCISLSACLSVYLPEVKCQMNLRAYRHPKKNWIALHEFVFLISLHFSLSLCRAGECISNTDSRIYFCLLSWRIIWTCLIFIIFWIKRQDERDTWTYWPRVESSVPSKVLHFVHRLLNLSAQAS